MKNMFKILTIASLFLSSPANAATIVGSYLIKTKADLTRFSLSYTAWGAYGKLTLIEGNQSLKTYEIKYPDSKGWSDAIRLINATIASNGGSEITINMVLLDQIINLQGQQLMGNIVSVVGNAESN